MYTAFPILIVLLLLSACEKAPLSHSAMPIASAPMAAKLVFTKKEWKTVVESSYVATQTKEAGEGVTEFMACFAGDEKPCSAMTFGSIDAFSKVHRFVTINSKIKNIGDIYKFVKVSVAAIECQAPRLILSAVYNSKGGWLFLSKAAFLADSELVMEENFPATEVKRDQEDGWVKESASWIANTENLTALKRLTEAKVVIIRFTGDKGYVTLDKDRTSDFIEDARTALKVLTAIEPPLIAAGGPTCTP